MANLMADLASPVSAFVRDCCARRPDARILRDDLYAAWKDWAERNGHRAGAKSTFGRDLRAVVPELGQTQPRIGGRQVWFYTHIGLAPVSPVSDDEDAGQDDFRDTGSPVSDQIAFGVAEIDTDSDTGSPVPRDGTKPQVNDGDTGDTRSAPNVG
jgi:putative DNA primase/helicase